MKTMTTVITSILLSLMALNLTASEDAYQKAMGNALNQLNNASSIEDYQAVANVFQRIANAEEGEWMPYYYAGLTRVYMSFQKGQDNDTRDEILEIAADMADKADELDPDNVEILILKGYINMAKLSVNPAIRGMLLSPKVNSQFGKAVEMDPNNPRANIMLARMKYGTAQFFKSSTDESCAMASRSLALFEEEASTDRGIKPSWGRTLAESMVKSCTKE